MCRLVPGSGTVQTKWDASSLNLLKQLMLSTRGVGGGMGWGGMFCSLNLLKELMVGTRGVGGFGGGEMGVLELAEADDDDDDDDDDDEMTVVVMIMMMMMLLMMMMMMMYDDV